jgi:hypothetical protein
MAGCVLVLLSAYFDFNKLGVFSGVFCFWYSPNVPHAQTYGTQAAQATAACPLSLNGFDPKFVEPNPATFAMLRLSLVWRFFWRREINQLKPALRVCKR